METFAAFAKLFGWNETDKDVDHAKNMPSFLKDLSNLGNVEERELKDLENAARICKENYYLIKSRKDPQIVRRKSRISRARILFKSDSYLNKGFYSYARPSLCPIDRNTNNILTRLREMNERDLFRDLSEEDEVDLYIREQELLLENVSCNQISQIEPLIIDKPETEIEQLSIEITSQGLITQVESRPSKKSRLFSYQELKRKKALNKNSKKKEITMYDIHEEVSNDWQIKAMSPERRKEYEEDKERRKRKLEKLLLEEELGGYRLSERGAVSRYQADPRAHRRSTNFSESIGNGFEIQEDRRSSCASRSTSVEKKVDEKFNNSS